MRYPTASLAIRPAETETLSGLRWYRRFCGCFDGTLTRKRALIDQLTLGSRRTSLVGIAVYRLL